MHTLLTVSSGSRKEGSRGPLGASQSTEATPPGPARKPLQYERGYCAGLGVLINARVLQGGELGREEALRPEMSLSSHLPRPKPDFLAQGIPTM